MICLILSDSSTALDPSAILIALANCELRQPVCVKMGPKLKTASKMSGRPWWGRSRNSQAIAGQMAGQVEFL